MSDYADRWNAALDRQVVQPQRELREAKKEIERLRARIEELEAKVSEQVRLRAHELRTFHPEDHVNIPKDRIDKAVEWHRLCLGGGAAYPWEYTGWMLEELGIVECGECGGRARGWINDDDMDQSCPSCNGHGWRVRHEPDITEDER